MKDSYQGNAKPYAMTLFTAADQESVMPLLQQLDAQGLNLSYRLHPRVPKRVIRRACAVIAFLSAQSMRDSLFENALLFAKSVNVPLVCVNLDQTPLSDSINRLLYTSNIIDASRYPTPEAIAERVMTAQSLVNPVLTKAQIDAAKRMTLMLIAGAALIVIAAGLIIWQRVDAANRARAAAVQTEKPLQDVAGILQSGMTEEDLQKISTLILVGDTMIDPARLNIYWAWDKIISQMEIDGKTVWSIDGKQVPRGTATDISLIGRMRNLEELILINQSVTDISPIKTLTNLKYLQLVDCSIENIEAVSGLPNLNELILDQTYVKSLAPLQSCKELEHFIGALRDCTSLEGLGIPGLQEVMLFETNQLTDLDALSACGSLTDLSIYSAEGLKDISGLSGCTSLTKLRIDSAYGMRSSAAFSSISTLKEVEITNSGFTDLSGLKQSQGLQSLILDNVPVRDFSWTSGMDQLTLLQVSGTKLNNFNFLKDLGVKFMELHFSGDVDDYSGLADIPSYMAMHIDPRNGNIAAVLPYIKNAWIDYLVLYNCKGIDFSEFPTNGVKHLTLINANLTDLEGLSAVPSLISISLESMNRLYSLKGLAECGGITRVSISDCAHLIDYEDLYQNPYGIITLVAQPVAPDLGRLQISDLGSLKLESMPSITDLSSLEAIETHINVLNLRGTDGISDLSVLRNMNVVEVIVPPQLEEQAVQLCNENVVKRYQVNYPDNELWAQDEQPFSLLSMDELTTLPDTALSLVKEFTIIGDCVPDMSTQGCVDYWDTEGQHFSIVDQMSGEQTPVGPGMIENIESLAKLKNLQLLRLYDQPLTSLQGIQAFADLRNLEIRKCPITDVSPAFTLTQLESLSLFNTQISSIQGVQNLSNLTRLDLDSTKVTDLSPLKDCSFAYANENGGLDLNIAYTSCEDLSAISVIPSFSNLNIDGYDATLWLPYIAGKPIVMLSANNCKLTNDQLAAIAAIPQLRELHLGWNENVTDLSALLACNTLEKISINQDNVAAIASIEGKSNIQFELYN